MKTQGNNNLEEEVFKIPFDMAPDIFRITVLERLSHELSEASSDKPYFRMTVQYDRTDARQKKAINDIQRLLDTYYDYRNASHEELNWR